MISGLEIELGIALCFVPGAQEFEVTLNGTGASLFPTMIGEFVSKFNIYDRATHFVNAYNTILTSTANSIVNVYWRGKNIEKEIYKI
ncbi:MAG: hypothetical protein E7180_03410 [Erysipelotrichaceae bacterium]|nr:hypothetical protein [Erysipelotrichaceae bacterium]